MAFSLMRVASQPGIQRDGTMLAAQAYVDAQWCRWQRGLPRKMGGYKNTQAYLTAVSRALYSQASAGYRYLYSGTATDVDFFTINNTGVASGVTNPSIPATTHPTTTGLPTGVLNTYPASQTNTWQFESQYDNASNLNLLFAFCGQNLLDPSNGGTNGNFPLYCTSIYSPSSWTQGVLGVNSNTPTARTGFAQVLGYGTGSDGFSGTAQALFPNGISGGICSLAPYMTVYGDDGFVAWSTPGYPTDFIGYAKGSIYVGATQITNQKIVKGLPLRAGGGYSPNGLYWSVDSVIRATFIGTTNGTFQYDQITSQSSILSDRCVLEHDGTFYWAGVDRFLKYNGVLQEIPNSMNLNWFYDNINPIYASKAFAMKIPRYGEIWWCYPRGTNTECSHAVIFNFRENTWYDTVLPPDLRSSGLHADNFVGNIMASPSSYTYATTNNSGTPLTATAYNLWQHEQGVDEIDGTVISAVPSYFTTSAITALAANPPQDAETTIGEMQPDFVQSGNLTVQVIKQNNAAQNTYLGSLATIYDNPQNLPTIQQQNIEQLTQFKDTAKIMYLQIGSNLIGGNYQLGRTMLETQLDGERDT